MIDIRQLLPVLEEKMKLFALKLKNTSEITSKGFTINAGAWANESGFCVAYLSSARSPHEETIDLTIEVSSNGDILSLETGIYLSDGSLIQDFGSVNLSGVNLDEIKSGLEKYFDQMSTNELVVFSNFLIEQKDEPD